MKHWQGKKITTLQVKGSGTRRRKKSVKMAKCYKWILKRLQFCTQFVVHQTARRMLPHL